MEKNAEFFSTLRNRVNNYFQQNQKSKFGNTNMTVKAVVMFSIYLVPFILLLTGLFTSPWLIILLFMVMGLGVAGIGLNIMHDANHGVYSKSSKLNKWMGYTMNLIGSNSTVWKIQHNVLHHTYTNIQDADEDIETIPFLLRFSPHQKRTWIHRFQHFYAWFFYGLMTIMRVLVSDFTKIFKYKKSGFFKSDAEFRKEFMRLILWRVFYFSYIVVLPIVLLPVSPWLLILSFFIMHYIAGFILAIIFQTAHVMPSTEFPLPADNGKIDSSWAAHELATTTNFSPKSRWFSWLIGGLNYQVEHHLFANICHVHYRDISIIVKQTAIEFGMPYKTEKSFFSALWSHFKMLKQLGTMETVKVAAN